MFPRKKPIIYIQTFSHRTFLEGASLADGFLHFCKRPEEEKNLAIIKGLVQILVHPDASGESMLGVI